MLQLTILSINITHKLVNGVIGVTDPSPLTEAPTLDNLLLCASFPDPLGGPSNISFACLFGLRGRYVVVLLLGNRSLCLCEVQVPTGEYGHEIIGIIKIIYAILFSGTLFLTKNALKS